MLESVRSGQAIEQGGAGHLRGQHRFRLVQVEVHNQRIVNHGGGMKDPAQGRHVTTDRGECVGEGRLVGHIAGLGKNFDAAFAAGRNKLPSRLVHRSPPPQKGQSLGACGDEPASCFQAEAAEAASHEVSAGQADRWRGR